MAEVLNTALRAGLNDLDHVSIVCFDFGGLVQGIMGDFEYTETQYLGQTGSADPDEFLFFDEFGHLTAAPNRTLGNACTAAILMQGVSGK